MKNDNVIINTEELDKSISVVKSSLEKIEEIEDELSILGELTYGTKIDISGIKKINSLIKTDLENIYPNLNRIKTQIHGLETTVNKMRKEQVNDINRRLDRLKGENPDIGGVKTTNTSSIFLTLKDKEVVNLVLDNIKQSGNDIGAIKTTDAVSVLIGMGGLE